MMPLKSLVPFMHASTNGKYIAIYRRSHRLSHIDPYIIFDDVNERGGEERTRWLLHETIIS
jgi:hypothetical protein